MGMGRLCEREVFSKSVCRLEEEEERRDRKVDECVRRRKKEK